MTRSPGQGLDTLQKAVHVAASALQRAEPAFDLNIGWAATYDDLFAGNIEQAAESSVLDRVLHKGRCILAGRGGGGKTQLLHRLMLAASERAVVAVLVDLKDWTKPDYAAWQEWTASDVGAGASFLLERFSQPSVDALTLDYLPPTAQKLVVVDGLNEIIAPVGQQILRALDDLAGDQVGLSILVADRLTRRMLPSPTRWALATVLPLTREFIAKHCGDEVLASPAADSLGTPYFLDAVISKGAKTESPSQTHRRFLHDHGGLDDKNLDAVAAAAYRLYEDAGTRTFSRPTLVDMVGEELTVRLQQTGVLIAVAANDVQFAHHLLHDYLAARYVATLTPESWTRALLRNISFDGSSFDTISMVLAQLGDGRADIFLRCLYDWNPYAAAYALSEIADTAGGPSFEMQQVIFAMLAEKTFDIVGPTRQQATDALAIVKAPSASEIKKAKSLPDLLATLTRVKSDVAWFNDWVALFTTASDKHIPDDVLNRVLDTDSVVGWTVANAARRTHITHDQLARLRASLVDDRSVVRWRIVHILGAHPSDENANLLAQVLERDPDRDVRYGVVRSLAEMAARASDDLRSTITGLLEQQAPALVAKTEKKIKEELKRALCILPEAAPASWYDVIASISRGLYVMESDPAEREGWRQYVELASARYSVS